MMNKGGGEKIRTTRLKILRDLAGISQIELAISLGINQSEVSQIERNLLRPRDSVVAALEEQFGHSFTALMEEPIFTFSQEK